MKCVILAASNTLYRDPGWCKRGRSERTARRSGGPGYLRAPAADGDATGEGGRGRLRRTDADGGGRTDGGEWDFGKKFSKSDAERRPQSGGGGAVSACPVVDVRT